MNPHLAHTYISFVGPCESVSEGVWERWKEGEEERIHWSWSHVARCKQEPWTRRLQAEKCIRMLTRDVKAELQQTAAYSIFISCLLFSPQTYCKHQFCPVKLKVPLKPLKLSRWWEPLTIIRTKPTKKCWSARKTGIFLMLTRTEKNPRNKTQIFSWKRGQ